MPENREAEETPYGLTTAFASEPRPGRIFWRFLNSGGFILMDIRGQKVRRLMAKVLPVPHENRKVARGSFCGYSASKRQIREVPGTTMSRGIHRDARSEAGSESGCNGESKKVRFLKATVFTGDCVVEIRLPGNMVLLRVSTRVKTAQKVGGDFLQLFYRTFLKRGDQAQ